MIPETAVLNETGQVAMKFRKNVPLRVKCSGYTYVFSIRANVPMAWVEPKHVPCMGKVKWACCGQRRKGGVIFANESDVRRWTNGGGR